MKEEGSLRQVGEKALDERLAFEHLLADIAARLANVSGERIAAEIEAALVRLVASLGYERCTFTEFAADGKLHVLCSAATGGIEALPRGPLGRPASWLADEIRAGAVCLSFSTLKNFEDDVTEKAGVFVPRVGPMTVTMALRNLVRLYRNSRGESSFP